MLWDMSARFFADNGFDKLIYIDAQPGTHTGTHPGDKSGELTMLTTLQPEWVIRYRDCGYAQIDPFFSICCTSFTPVSTGVAYADSHKKWLSQAQMTLISEAAEFGINAGFSSTIRRAGPQGVAGWNIGSSLSRAEVDALRADRGHMLRLAARHAHDVLRRAHLVARAKSLSPRETECLALLAQGQRTKDIARALDLSSAAVELYLRNARSKLGATTREQAVAIGFAQGLL